MEPKYSDFTKRVKSSEIREILKYSRRNEMISFAGGLPDPSLFPLDDIKRITKEILDEKAYIALQYGPTPGEPEFIDAVTEHMHHFEEEARPEQICITSSSQQGLDLLSMIMIDKDSEIIVELPSYLGAIQAFERNGAKMNGIRLSGDGMDMNELESVIKEKYRKNAQIKFIYTIPDYQNPAGISLSLEKRRQLLDLAQHWEIPIIEDSPYRELCFSGDTLPSLWSLSGGQGVIQLKTLSKMLFPGMRLGWVVAEEAIVNRFALMKQSVDLCSPSFNQLIIARFFKEGKMKQTIRKAIDIYRVKNAAMQNALERYMPGYVRWSKPTGGMFLWLELPAYADSKEMISTAIQRNVVYVIGEPFHCNGEGKNTLRLNYSFPTIEQIELGIQRLAETIKEYCDKKQIR